MTDLIIFEEALFSYLSARLSVGKRIYPLVLKQKTAFPAIKYKQVSDPRIHTHSGTSRLRYPRYQFDCYAEKYLQAKALGEELIYLVDSFTGQMAGIEVGASFVEDARDNYDPETFRHWVSVDAIIWHQG